MEYYGPGNSRTSRHPEKLVGLFEGRKITELRVGSLVRFRFNGKGEINGFYTLFDADTSHKYYETVTTASDVFGNMPWKLSMMNATNDVSYPYGNYANRAISTDISQNNAKVFCIWQSKDYTDLGRTFSYVVIDTRFPLGYTETG